MPASLRLSTSLVWFALAAALFTAPARADQLVYVALDQPCRLLDTRTSTGGPGPLTAAHGPYLFGTSIGYVSNPAQHGSATGCGIPNYVAAVSVNMNLLNATASGNIATWSADAGSTAPNIGTAVYNPTVASPAAGQVQYNTGYTSMPVSNSDGSFFLQVANGQIDMTINVVGYWLPISRTEIRSAEAAVALGYGTTASGIASTALGDRTIASGGRSTAMGNQTRASGGYATAMGNNTTASGYASTALGSKSSATGDTSVAMGYETLATGFRSIALGYQVNVSGDYATAMGQLVTSNGFGSLALGTSTVASGDLSTALGTAVSTNDHRGSFIYGDASARTGIINSADNQFMAIADGGFVLVSNKDGSTGVELAHGSGSWTTLSDRSAKTAVQPVDGREVLKKVAALPLNTWQYKAQDAKYRHMGPMAQDFYSAFQLGESDKGIDTVDADGVALAAIQGLNAELSEKNRQIAALDGKVTSLRSEMAAQAKSKDAEIAALHVELSAQKRRVASLELLAGDVAHLKAQFATFQQTSPAPVTVALTQP